MADEIPNQNVIRIYLSLADCAWRAQIGPDDGRGVRQLGGTPCQALGRLISKIHGGKYSFDPTWCPEPLASVPYDDPARDDVGRWELGEGSRNDQLTGGETGAVSQPIHPVSTRPVGQPKRTSQGADLVQLAARAVGGG